MFRKVLILSASVGAGHLRAADALEKAFKKLNAAEEVKNIDVLNYTNPLFRRLYGKAYLDMVNTMPEVLGWMYDSLDKPWQNEKRRLALDRLNTQPFIKLLKKEKPDIAVCTHFLPAEIISWLKAKEKIHCPQAIVVTDFDAHALWLCHHYENILSRLKKRAFTSKNWEFPPVKLWFPAFRLIRFLPKTKTKSKCAKNTVWKKIKLRFWFRQAVSVLETLNIF